MYVEPVHDRTNSTLPDVWVGSDRIAIFVKSAWAKAKERPMRLNRCSTMDIRLSIEMRCARRKMMRHTSAIVAVPSQANTRLPSIGVTWSTNALGACSYALDCKTAAESCPVNGSEAPMRRFYVQRDVMRLPEPRRAPKFRGEVSLYPPPEEGRGYCCVFCCVYFNLTSHTCIVSLSRVLTTFVTTS